MSIYDIILSYTDTFFTKLKLLNNSFYLIFDIGCWTSNSVSVLTPNSVSGLTVKKVNYQLF